MIERRSWRIAFASLLLAVCATPSLPAQTATVVDPGPGRAGRSLRDLLGRPHRVIASRDSVLSFKRDSVITETLVIVGPARVTVASKVAGSIVVIGGDLFLHPGVAIEGDARAYGGGVYATMLGTVGGSVISERDFTFDVEAEGSEYRLVYRELAIEEFERFELPLRFGVRVPTYDRVNGLSVGWGPRVNWARPRLSVEPVITYRSDLGDIDPDVRGRLDLSRVSAVTAAVGRTTLTNEGWIRGPYLNSFSLITGTDVRNYRRANRIDVRYERELEREWGVIIPMVGVLAERSRSVPPGNGATSGPWSLLKRNDSEEGMLRPNPPILPGTVSSVIGGGEVVWESEGVKVGGTALLEGAVGAPNDDRFGQVTVDFRIDFPTFRDHTFRFEAHGLTTFGEVAPPQRFSYLGGSGTLPTMDLLSMGGGQLVFLESRYTIPITQIAIPLLGSPTVSLRHMIGSAGVDKLPGFVNNVGVRLAMSLLKADFTIDPESRDTDFSIGLSFGR
jgi:hypothetical protein